MAAKTMVGKIILVNKTSAEWVNETTVISKGLPVVEFTTTGETKLKIGDGVSTFDLLPYVGADVTASTIISALGFTPLDSSKSGVAGGVATLDASGKVPTSQLPSYVDDVVEVDSIDSAPEEGETGKIYVDVTTGKTYRWSGTMYAEISAGDLVTASENNGYIKVNGTDIPVYTPVQADWNETDESNPSFIKNKPTIPSGSVVDSTLSEESENPVQNKIITAELAKKIDESDTLILNCTL